MTQYKFEFLKLDKNDKMGRRNASSYNKIY